MTIKFSSNKSLDWAERIITWGAPMALIPTFRFINDSDKPTNLRKELFVRDSISYAMGTAVFFAVTGFLDRVVNKGFKSKLMKPVENVFKTSSKAVKRLLPMSMGCAMFCLWSGFCGPEISKRMFKKPSVKNEPIGFRRTSIFGASMRKNQNNSSGYYGVQFLAKRQSSNSLKV